ESPLRPRDNRLLSRWRPLPGRVLPRGRPQGQLAAVAVRGTGTVVLGSRRSPPPNSKTPGRRPRPPQLFPYPVSEPLPHRRGPRRGLEHNPLHRRPAAEVHPER
ncbi:unnamed protein product, partial [Musa acuminata subsp. burmannicoides]